MTSRLWITLFVATALIAGAVLGARALPNPDQIPTPPVRTDVVSARIEVSNVVDRIATSPTPPRRLSSTTGATTSSTTSSTTRSATATSTTARIGLAPGPLAAPSPTTPVALAGGAPVLDRVPTTDKVIFLGVDDGLVRDPALIALLREARVPLSLFLNRDEAREGVNFFRAMQMLGATVQGHTIGHPRLRNLGWSSQRHEICDELGDEALWFGDRPTLFRPPYGEWNDTTRLVAAGCGLKALILWRGATNDGRLDLVGGPEFHPGDILLLHFRADLIENLRLVFAKAVAEGYRIGRLEDYLGTGPSHRMFSPAG